MSQYILSQDINTRQETLLSDQLIIFYKYNKGSNHGSFNMHYFCVYL
jgi:hypothetical protein